MIKRRKIQLSKDLADLQQYEDTEQELNVPVTGQNIKRHKTTTDCIGKINSTQSLSNQKGTIYTSLTDRLFMKEVDSIRENSLKTGSQLNHEGRLDQKTIIEYAEKALNQTNILACTNLRKKKRFDVNLKDIISKQKVNNLKNRFITKLKRNNVQQEPIDFIGFQNEGKESIWQKQVFNSHPILDNIMALVNITMVLCLIVRASLELVFEELRGSTANQVLQILGVFFFIIQIIYNSVTIKTRGGKMLKTFEEILEDYLYSFLIIDLLNFLIIVIALAEPSPVLVFLRLFVVTKLPQCLEKLERLEVVFIKNYHNEQYWSLVKVVLFNFCFAHVLAVFLSAMARLDPHDNWHSAKGISSAGWLPKYIWAYYWGVNIMLTVGFGDLVATTHQEALCLVFIEIVSVMCLAYNISWIGTLISNIRAQDLERGKNFKTFRQLSGKYDLPSELEWRISNYIQESVNIRKKFNIEEERAFISSLPSSMKQEYLKESNKSVFQELPFFSHLVDRTLYNFAEKIQMGISHPEQLLRKIDDEYNLIILREGEIGYSAKRRGCDSNDIVIDRVKVRSHEKPFILGLQFLTRTRPIYQTKSLQYSVIYSLAYNDLIGILRQSNMDYILFCFLRDRNRATIDEFQVLPCDKCGNGQKHTKFTCPRLHYSPLQSMIIHKERYKEGIMKNQSNPDRTQRIQKQKVNALVYNLALQQAFQNQSSSNPNRSLKYSRRKKTNPFCEKVNQMRRLRESLLYQRSFPTCNQDIYLRNTTEVIKRQFQKYFHQDSFDDPVWTIESDKGKNFKEYFPDSNACNLEYQFKLEPRLQKIKQRQINDEIKMETIGQKTSNQPSQSYRGQTSQSL